MWPVASSSYCCISNDVWRYPCLEQASAATCSVAHRPSILFAVSVSPGSESGSTLQNAPPPGQPPFFLFGHSLLGWVLVSFRVYQSVCVDIQPTSTATASNHVLGGLQGGFKAWLRQGLPVREGSFYGTSVLETFSDDVEVFAENANAFVR